MTGRQKLIAIKLVHTAVWLFFNFVIFYMLYAVMVNKIGTMYWICLGLILLEGITLLAFRMFCPLTLIARKFSDSGRHNFDIYLPEWLAKHTKLIYTSLVVISIVIMLFRLL
jgi:hypothetical protein